MHATVASRSPRAGWTTLARRAWWTPTAPVQGLVHRQVWKPALERAGLPKAVRMHNLRHAHASWLLAGYANILVVQERLGHDSLTTTQKYFGAF